MADEVRPLDEPDLVFDAPAGHIKTIDVPEIPRRIEDGLKQFEETGRGESWLSVASSVHVIRFVCNTEDIFV